MPLPMVISGFNRVLKPPINWDAERHGHCADFHVRAVDYAGILMCETAWELTDLDIAAALRGERLILRVAGNMPPVALFFEAPPRLEPISTDGGNGKSG